MNLVKVYENRPVWIKHDDWNVCISIHDNWFIIELSKWRRKLIQFPEDRILIERYKYFLREETYYYWLMGLRPPIKIFKKTSREIKCKYCGNIINKDFNTTYRESCNAKCDQLYRNKMKREEYEDKRSKRRNH